MNLFFYLLTIYFTSNGALALRCYTGATYGTLAPVNSSSLMDCSFFGIMGWSCMKMTDYASGASVRFCNNYNCSQMLQGRLANTPCINDTYSNLNTAGFTYQSQLGVNYSPTFGSYVSLCCCSGDSCNSAEASGINHFISLFCIIFYFSNHFFNS